MSHFILMLTKNDQTVPDAVSLYRSIRHSKIRFVGFKDIGIPLEELAQLAREIKQDGKKVMLEVVSATRDAELQSVEAAVKLDVDYLLGGRNAKEAVKIIRNTPIRYFPFAGHTVGHPTQLTGSLEEIVEDARYMASLPGVHGLDLLAYRFKGNAEELARRVVREVSVPIIAAGSIDSAGRVQAMREAGAWAFTIGSAIFEGSFLQEPFKTQVETILQLEGITA